MEELRRHVETQVQNILCAKVDTSLYLEEAVRRTRVCLEESASKYCALGGTLPFSVFHSVQYGIFLYHLSRVARQTDGNGQAAEKFYYLNKVLNSVDIFYEVELPAIWGCEHPLGSVMGRAVYGDRFFFYQGCTVGGNNGQYPSLGSDVLMYSNSKILGKCRIGNNVILSANAFVKAQDIPDNCIVFGQTPSLVIKEKTEEEMKQMTRHIWKPNNDRP